MGLQLGDMRDVMHTHKPSLQIKLIGTLANTLKNLVEYHLVLV